MMKKLKYNFSLNFVGTPIDSLLTNLRCPRMISLKCLVFYSLCGMKQTSTIGGPTYEAFNEQRKDWLAKKVDQRSSCNLIMYPCLFGTI
jgi:hypothetical protein